MSEFHIFAIVEGHSEVEAVRKLLFRIWESAEQPIRLQPVCYRMGKSEFISKADSRQRILTLASRKARAANGRAGVLVLMDNDKDCCKAKEMKNIRADIARTVGSDIPTVFVLAERKYESWLVAGFGGGGDQGKGWLEEQSEELGLERKYKNVVDQKKLTGTFDMDKAAEANKSFRRFRARVLELAQA